MRKSNLARLIFFLFSIYLFNRYSLASNNLSSVAVDLPSYLLMNLFALSFYLTNITVVRKLSNPKLYLIGCFLANLIPHSFEKNTHLLLSYLSFVLLTIVFYQVIAKTKNFVYYLIVFEFLAFLIILLLFKDIQVYATLEYLYMYAMVLLMMYIEYKEV